VNANIIFIYRIAIFAKLKTLEKSILFEIQNQSSNLKFLSYNKINNLFVKLPTYQVWLYF